MTVVTPVMLGTGIPSNRSLARVTLSRQRLDGRDRVTPAARITRVGGEREDTAEVVLELEGMERMLKTDILDNLRGSVHLSGGVNGRIDREKGEFLKAFGADIFFDDQQIHIDSASGHVTWPRCWITNRSCLSWAPARHRYSPPAGCLPT